MDRKNTILQVTEEELRNIIAEEVGKAVASIYTAKQNGDESNQYLTRAEVCEKLHISLGTFHNLAKQGKIKTSKIGGRTLVVASDLDSLVADGFQKYGRA